MDKDLKNVNNQLDDTDDSENEQKGELCIKITCIKICFASWQACSETVNVHHASQMYPAVSFCY